MVWIIHVELATSTESPGCISCHLFVKFGILVVNKWLTRLQYQKLNRWKDDVIIVATDMRLWNATEKADLMVSELLGSFGDNELSPECLDGAQRFLKGECPHACFPSCTLYGSKWLIVLRHITEDGISIPSSYSSYICPTQTHKIYAEIADCIDRDKPYYQRYEQPYVVHLQTVYQLAPVQKLFTFDHPNKSKYTLDCFTLLLFFHRNRDGFICIIRCADEIIDNTRYEKLTFEVQQDSVVHGFSGFFDTVLYKDVKLSIVPDTFSEGMFSWFPIFFPIRVSL